MTGNTVLLFDIDGTLVSTGGAGRRAMEAAFALHTGRADACSHFSMAGMTDRLIVRRGLQAVGHTEDDAKIDSVIEAYLATLQAELGLATGYALMPGVRATLERVAATPGVAVGLGTGNVRRGAELKLRHGGIWDFFSYGGFGCDAEARDQVILAGARRGAAALGRPLDQCKVWVIGDTPLDVAAAHANGFKCLAVCTGGATRAELAACHPEILAQSLDDSVAYAVLNG